MIDIIMCVLWSVYFLMHANKSACVLHSTAMRRVHGMPVQVPNN